VEFDTARPPSTGRIAHSMQPASPGHAEPVDGGAWNTVPPSVEEPFDPGWTEAAGVEPAPAPDGGGWVRRLHVEEAAARNDHGAALFAEGRYREAAQMFEDALAGCRALLGPEHPATLTVAGNLGVAQVAAGQRRRGLKLVSDNLADRVRVLGDDHPDTLTARDALAAVHRAAGNVDDAIAMSGKVALQRARHLGPTHPDTLTSRMGLALAHMAAGDVSSAHRLLAAALADAEEAYGARHHITQTLLECGQAFGLIGTEA
jgi:Tfp pilus assembly protein PilF